MAEQLSYVIVTSHSLRKSRTGGILSRLIARTGLDLVSARMYAPSRELVEKYAAQIITEGDPRHRATQELIRQYVLDHFLPTANDERPSVLLFVFRGDDAVEKIRAVVGHIVHERTSGETIRDTFGDYVTAANGELTYFEPAVLAPPNATIAESHLKLWAEYSDRDGGLLKETAPANSEVQETLVLIKPDNFKFSNARAGGIIDIFSRTGLNLIACKVHHMSVSQAKEFYGPVLDVLQDRLKTPVAERAARALEKELEIAISDDVKRQLGELLGPVYGRHSWEAIIEFMSGARPSALPESEHNKPGSAKCVALVYQGVDAVRKIREVLGPTDPAKAPHGTIRREFGQSLMVNAAHASDAPENAVREMEIIQIQENNLKPLIEAFYANHR